ncbi:MAG TPA: hypothetical protein VGB73_08945 [Pyrinomonadaceae bacterium]|jgi:hypothetical protein
MLRSILAVIAGSVVWMVTALGTDAILMSLWPQAYSAGGRVESVPLLLFTMFYAVLFGVLAGYVTAVIARRAEVKHALALGILQLLMGIVATINFWDTAPAWYHLIFLALVTPSNLLGGWLRANRRRKLGAGAVAAH